MAGATRSVSLIDIDIVVVYPFVGRPSQQAKLLSILHYFQKIGETAPEGHVTFSRQVSQ